MSQHESTSSRQPGATVSGRDAVADFVESVRHLQDQLGFFDAPDDVVDQATAQAAALADLLAAWRVGPGESPLGMRWDLPGRGHPLVVPMTVEAIDDESIDATVRFRDAHLGVTGAVHGGYIPMPFDEAFGMIAIRAHSPVVTGSLAFDYRRPTPTGVDLRLRASITETADRKVKIAGHLSDGQGRIVVEARALMVRLRVHE